MTTPIRLASLLLLVYPALILAGSVRAALEYDYAGSLLSRLLLVIFLLLVSIHLWRGRPWAYTAALVSSAGLGVVLVLYDVAVARLWGREAWEGFSVADHILDFLPAVACLAAFGVLLRADGFAQARRRALAVGLGALGVELVLMALIARLGVGSFFGSRPWYQLGLDLSQLPGEIILTQMGMCCGYENETLISDWIDPHWGGITRHGIPALVAANALGLFPVLGFLRARWSTVAARTPAPAAQ